MKNNTTNQNTIVSKTIVNEHYFSMDCYEKGANWKMPVYEETIENTSEGIKHTRKYLKNNSHDGSLCFDIGDIATYLKKNKWQYMLHSFNGEPSTIRVNGSRTWLNQGREISNNHPWSVWASGLAEVLYYKDNCPHHYRQIQMNKEYTSKFVILMSNAGYYENDTGYCRKSIGNQPCVIDFDDRSYSKNVESIIKNGRVTIVPIILLNGTKAWVDQSMIIW